VRATERAFAHGIPGAPDPGATKGEAAYGRSARVTHGYTFGVRRTAGVMPLAVVWSAICACGGVVETGSGTTGGSSGTGASAGRAGSSTGGGGSSTGTGGSTVSFQELVKAFCDGTRTCCQRAGYPLDPLVDCESAFQQQIDVFALVEKGTVTVNSAASQTCIEAFRLASSTCNAAEQRNPACKKIFTGTIAPEAPCEKSEECAGDGAICLPSASGPTNTPTTGTCKLARRGEVGDACISTCWMGSACGVYHSVNPQLTVCYEEDGLFCSSADTDERCAPLSSIGAPCTSYDSCGTKLLCSPSSVCTERKALGAACSADECDVALSCISGTCGAPPVASQKTCNGNYN